jgi:hypothetical protein
VTGLISVVIPVFNAAQYLDQARDRLAALTLPVGWQLELVVIDDHSSDGSADLLATWRNHFARFTLLTAEGRGVAQARNQAVRACNGEFVWFTDADDDWSPRVIESMLTAALESPADLAVCNAVRVRPNGLQEPIADAPHAEVFDGRETLLRLLSGGIQGHLWNKLFRRTALPLDMFPLTRAHSDLGGMLGLAPSLASVVAVPESLYTYSVREGSILNSRGYRWDDLHDCLKIAASATARTFGRQPAELLIFKYRNVIIPVANEQARRQGVEDPLAIQSSRRQNRALISLDDIRRLLRLGQRQLALQATLLWAVPTVYDRLYRAMRSDRQPRLRSSP